MKLQRSLLPKTAVCAALALALLLAAGGPSSVHAQPAETSSSSSSSSAEAASSSDADKRVSLAFDGAPLEIVAAAIKRASGAKVVLKGGIDRSEKISFVISNATLPEILDATIGQRDWAWRLNEAAGAYEIWDNPSLEEAPGAQANAVAARPSARPLRETLDGLWRLRSVSTGEWGSSATWEDGANHLEFVLRLGDIKTFERDGLIFTVRLTEIDYGLRLAVLELVSTTRNGEALPALPAHSPHRKAVYSLLAPVPSERLTSARNTSSGASAPASGYRSAGWFPPTPPTLKEALRGRWDFSYAMGPPIGDTLQGEAQWRDNANQEDFKLEPGQTRTFQFKNFEYTVKLASIDGDDFAANLETIKITVGGYELPESVVRVPAQKATYSLLNPRANP